MKKLICIVLAALLLTACGAEGAKNQKATAQIRGKEVTYEKWEETGLPTKGSYILTEDVELEAAVTLTGDLDLHLDGHKIAAKSGVELGNMFVIPAGTTMTVYDEPGGADILREYDSESPDAKLEMPAGTIVSSDCYVGNMTVSSIFRVEGELVIAGGHIDASPVVLEDAANGLAAYVVSGGKLEVAGGVVTGGTSWSFVVPEEEGAERPYGYGGAVYVEKGAECLISGGVVWKGSAYRGGNIYVAGDEEGAGKLVITGGALVGGEATERGGNALVAGIMEMSDGILYCGTSYKYGGNLCLSGQLEMTGGVMEDGVADVNTVGNGYGGNIMVNGLHAKVHITDAELTGGQAPCKESHGGNIAVVGAGAESFLVENTEIYGGSGHRGGNVYIGSFNKDISLDNLDYTFTNVNMDGGLTTYRGANLCADSKNPEKTISVTFNNCELAVEDYTELNLAVGAGAKDVSFVNIVVNGGKLIEGDVHLYGSTTMVTNGVTFVESVVSGNGIHTENP